MIKFSFINYSLFVLWKVNWKRASVNPGKLIRKRLQWSRQVILEAWTKVMAVEIKRSRGLIPWLLRGEAWREEIVGVFGE